jgi:glycine/serine hydroxymethyltransferase
MPRIAAWVDRVLNSDGDSQKLAAVAQEVQEVAAAYPVPALQATAG